MITTNSSNLPTNASNRILFLDILRGLAIFFIFLVNIQYLSGTHYYSDEIKNGFATTSIDRILEMAVFTFVNRKFYYIFSMLFGVGFALQWNSAAKQNRPFVPFFTRRMMFLLAIGLLHMIFVWSGDILTLYALIGLLLIVFRNRSNSQLLRWSVFMFSLPILHWLFMYATKSYYYYPLLDIVNQRAGSLGLSNDAVLISGTPVIDQQARVATESFSQWISMQVYMPINRLAIIIMQGRLFKVLGLFLLGMWIGRKVLHNNLLENISFLKKTMRWGFVIGIPFNLLLAIFHFGSFSGNLKHFLSHLFYALGVAPLACAFGAAVALTVYARPDRLSWAAPVGRTALTNYLAQSLISIFIFYGIGMGYFKAFSYTQVAGIAVAIFAFQVVLSTLWLQYFRFGPIEWVWRQLSYGTFINPFKPKK